jgi:hypothetical protein
MSAASGDVECMDNAAGHRGRYERRKNQRLREIRARDEATQPTERISDRVRFIGVS